MKKPDLSQLLEDTAVEAAPLVTPPASEAAIRPRKSAGSAKPGEVNVSAYFPAEVKSALRQVQAKTGKNIKGCLAEALQLLFRKHNVPVTIPDE